jgi:hypothetical protein
VHDGLVGPLGGGVQRRGPVRAVLLGEGRHSPLDRARALRLGTHGGLQQWKN